MRSLLSVGLLAALAIAVMLPRLASPAFGLLDDAVTLVIARHTLDGFTAGHWTSTIASVFTLEHSRGRFHPLSYWYYFVQYYVWGEVPLAFFVVQTVILAVTGIMVAAIGATLTGNRLAGLLSGTTYVILPPVFENYYTLSKAEAPMVLCLCLSVLLLVRSLSTPDGNRTRAGVLFYGSCSFLLMAYFTKETAHAMVIVSGLWAVSAWWRYRQGGARREVVVKRAYFAANVLCLIAYWSARIGAGTLSVSAGGGILDITVSCCTQSEPLS